MGLPNDELLKAAVNVANAATFLRQAGTPTCNALADKVDAVAQAIADAHAQLTP